MRYAIGINAGPDGSLPVALAGAQAKSFQGIELRFSGGGSEKTADAFTPGKIESVRASFADSGLEIACLATMITTTGDRGADAKSAEQLRAFVQAAGVVGCRRVSFRGTQVAPGRSRTSPAVMLGEWLLPLADDAAGLDVTLLVENGSAFSSAREIWKLLDRLAHPAIACAWDVSTGMRAGESPARSVPLLNSKIQYVRVPRLTSAASPADAPPGEEGSPTVPLVRELIHRLRGIGYAGYVSVNAAVSATGEEPGTDDGTATAILLESWSREGVAATGGERSARAKGATC